MDNPTPTTPEPPDWMSRDSAAMLGALRELRDQQARISSLEVEREELRKVLAEIKAEGQLVTDTAVYTMIRAKHFNALLEALAALGDSHD